MRTVAGLMVLCGLLFNLGCQINPMDISPSEDSTASPNAEPASTLLPTSPTSESTTSSTSIPGEAGMQTLIDKAMADLSQRFAIPLNEISLLESTSVVWPDGSLGCPEEGMEYAQVLVPGYLIRLKSGDQEFEYHTSRGTEVVYCENPMPPVEGTPGDV